MGPVVASGAAGAGEDIGADTDADVGVGTSEDYGENDGTGSSGVALPEDETPPRGDSLCRSPRSTGMSMLKSRAAMESHTSRSNSSLET